MLMNCKVWQVPHCYHSVVRVMSNYSPNVRKFRTLDAVRKGTQKPFNLCFSTTRTVYLHQMPETCGKAKNHHPHSSHFSGKTSLSPGRRACSKWRHQEALRSLGIALTIHGLGWTIEHARFTQMQSEMDNTGIEVAEMEGLDQCLLEACLIWWFHKKSPVIPTKTP